MYKLITKDFYMMKSYDIYELWKFIISNRFEYTFFKGYTMLSYKAFLKIFLAESRNYDDYLRLERKLNKTKSIYDYVKDQHI